jgi:hypothetical protein
MTTDPIDSADPADVADQDHDISPAPENTVPATRDEMPDEADEADVVEQQTDVPGWDDDEQGG